MPHLRPRRSRLTRAVACAAVVTALGAGTLLAGVRAVAAPVSPSPSPASQLHRHDLGTPQPWGTTLVPGSQWAGHWASTGDLNVYSNGDGSQDRSVATGLAYECVELAQRWAHVRFGEQSIWPVAFAYQMWDAAPTLAIPFSRFPNGGAMPPQFGDLVVFDRTSSFTAGHVAVVSASGPGWVEMVEQNWSSSAGGGHVRLSMTGNTIPPRDGMPVIGWLRSSTETVGYWLLARDGGVFPYGTAGGYGSTGGMRLNQPIVSMAATIDAHGYWLVAGDGGIFPFGDAPGLGSTGSTTLNQPVLAMAATPTGKGYWLVARDGGIFPFGDACGCGSTGGMHLNQPIVGMAATPTGRGYWLVASDGGIFPFGDATRGLGSLGNVHLNQPIVGMASTLSGRGYWLVAADGGIFPFGDARGFGSAGGMSIPAPVVGMARTPGGTGYWLAGSDGSIYAFGDAENIGSMGGSHLNAPAISVASVDPRTPVTARPWPPPSPLPHPSPGPSPRPVRPPSPPPRH